METKKDILNRLFVENNLTSEDVFKHQHYTIITRSGIEKIQANLQIYCAYEVIKCEPNFAVVKAKGEIRADSWLTLPRDEENESIGKTSGENASFVPLLPPGLPLLLTLG